MEDPFGPRLFAKGGLCVRESEMICVSVDLYLFALTELPLEDL